MSMLSYNLCDGYQTALLAQQVALKEAADLRMAEQVQRENRTESKLMRRFRLMFRLRRALFRVAPRMARSMF